MGDEEKPTVGPEQANWKAPETGGNPEEPNLEAIAEGKGLEEVERIGWTRYRGTLAGMNYAGIIDRQIPEIRRLETESVSQKGTPEWVINAQNIEAKHRAQEMGQWFLAEYGPDKSSPFFAHVSGRKIEVKGRKVRQEASTENPLTRMYFSVPTKNSPEAFKELWASLADAGIMGDVELALNLESFEGDSINKPSETNNIILYAYGGNPELMKRIAKAIKTAKTQKPELWSLTPKDKARAKTAILREFMIPLDDTTAFVEASSTTMSYHAGPYGEIKNALGYVTPSKIGTLKDLSAKFKQYDPAQPKRIDSGIGSNLAIDRKYHMPALIQ